MTHGFQKGRIKRWNDEKGFGFISPADRGKDVFIHISALKGSGRRPMVDDVILYQTQTGSDGKVRAINARIESLKTLQPKQKQERSTLAKKGQWPSKAIAASVLIMLGIFAFSKFFFHDVRNSSITSIPDNSTDEQNTKIFSCEGKVYCSEMVSCEEAMFYIRNCPGTKMDGDADGIPCESQWCSW